MKRTYQNAVSLLESRRRIARPDRIPPPSEMSGVKSPPTFRGTPSLHGMRQWLQILGYSENAINSLNVIHVAGTKGKGSTCAFTRSFLLAHGLRTGFPQKVGMYTSPGLQCIRDRIQINDRPISEELFTESVFEVWERLSQNSSLDDTQNAPHFLQFLALTGFHTFIKEDVDAVIIETHQGGEYDATNVVDKPVVTGITTIGLDHIAQLGPGIENIAWHKAGIFKSSAPAFSAPQDQAVMEVLRARAGEKATSLKFVEDIPWLPDNASAIQVPVQRINCSLAITLANTFLERKVPSQHLTSGDISQGIEKFSWPGRFQVKVDGRNHWYLDGAHNQLSIKQAAKWFINMSGSQSHPSRPLILIFSHISNIRDGAALLKCLAEALAQGNVHPDFVIFTTYQEREDDLAQFSHKTLQTGDSRGEYCDVWESIHPDSVLAREQSIQGALNLARSIGEQSNGMQTLVTGSLHLVGGALNLLQAI